MQCVQICVGCIILRPAWVHLNVTENEMKYCQSQTGNPLQKDTAKLSSADKLLI